MTKLAFRLDVEPEHKVLPLPLSRERWFDLAQRQNNLRAMNMQRQLTTWEIEETYRAIYG